MKNVQEVLRLMADDLQDLRANLAALAAQPCTAAVALAAKNRAIEENRQSYVGMLEKIEKLV
jgi:hypothetical protein